MNSKLQDHVAYSLNSPLILWVPSFVVIIQWLFRLPILVMLQQWSPVTMWSGGCPMIGSIIGGISLISNLWNSQKALVCNFRFLCHYRRIECSCKAYLIVASIHTRSCLHKGGNLHWEILHYEVCHTWECSKCKLHPTQGAPNWMSSQILLWSFFIVRLYLEGEKMIFEGN